MYIFISYLVTRHLPKFYTCNILKDGYCLIHFVATTCFSIWNLLLSTCVERYILKNYILYLKKRCLICKITDFCFITNICFVLFMQTMIDNLCYIPRKYYWYPQNAKWFLEHCQFCLFYLYFDSTIRHIFIASHKVIALPTLQ